MNTLLYFPAVNNTSAVKQSVYPSASLQLPNHYVKRCLPRNGRKLIKFSSVLIIRQVFFFYLSTT